MTSTFESMLSESETTKYDLSNTKKTLATEAPRPPIPAWVAPIVLGFCILIFYLISLNFYALPTGLRIENESDNLGRFIGERAQNLLEEFVQIGEKVVGSEENEVLAVEFLQEQIEKIIATRNATAHDIEMMLTSHTGSFYWNDLQYYSEIKNLAVRLKPAGQVPETSLLINSHFDTVPLSPGACDAGILVMVMLEILRVLSQTDRPFRHSIIFLFNGAEEAGLIASHAFTQDHPWAKSVRTVLNFDSAGNGGREILFQAHPDHSWLIQFYKKYAPHPYASALSEELFQANLVPSDTDFRIFRDFGEMPGMDFAYSYNGYVYHTQYDRFESISLGTYQHTGDNLLEVAKALANAAELDVEAELPDGKMIFFDYLGWFMISYTDTEGIIINSIIAASSIVIMLTSMFFMARRSDLPFIKVFQEFCLVFIIQFFSIVVAVGLCLLLAIIYDAVGRSMSWFSHPWTIFGLYFCPFYLMLGLGPALYLTFRKNFKLQISQEVVLFLHAHNFLITLFLIILTGLQIRSAFLLVIVVIFYTATALINLIFSLQDKSYHWVYLHLFGQLFPFMFYSNLSFIIFTTFIPMSGRGDPLSNPEIFICITGIAMAVLLGGFIIPLVGLCRQSIVIIGGFGILTIIAFIVMATPVGFPYMAEESAQRHLIYHTKREFYNYSTHDIRRSDAGYLFLPMDRHATRYFLQDNVEEMRNAQRLDTECMEELFCGMPFFATNMHRNSYWIPADAPYFNEPLSLIRVVNQVPEGRYEFEVSGPSRLEIFIAIAKGVKITNWSFHRYVFDSGLIWFDRETFMIVLTSGNPSRSINFWIDLEIPTDLINSPAIYIGLTGHYTHHVSERTDAFQSFLGSFPDWASVMAWTSFYQGYDF